MARPPRPPRPYRPIQVYTDVYMTCHIDILPTLVRSAEWHAASATADCCSRQTRTVAAAYCRTTADV